VFAEHDAVSVVLSTAFTWLAIWAVTDAHSRSGLAFRAAGHSKTLWIALPLVGMVFAVLGNPVGFLMGGAFGEVYLVGVRDNIRRVGEPAAADTFRALGVSDLEHEMMESPSVRSRA
jgi:hypothetical protein